MGAGIVLNDRLFTGLQGMAGEIGHSILQIDGPACSCGRRGCAETFFGARALGQLPDPARGGVPGGTVTFSALPALRSLPYRVVCVIGLDQGAFPGSDRPAEFDLMAARPQAGDRQRRLDDRNLFLDLILSAREVLHLSYVGRSVRDGSALPPSVLVALTVMVWLLAVS